MRQILKLIGVLWIIFVFPAALSGQTVEIPESIVLSFRAGNAAELAKYFHDNVELIILEKEDVYSRSQAEQIIRKFFQDYTPDSFRIIFEGGKESSHYAIGSMSSSGSNYRIYILIKKQDGEPRIHQLRIEKEDENDQ